MNQQGMFIISSVGTPSAEETPQPIDEYCNGKSVICQGEFLSISVDGRTQRIRLFSAARPLTNAAAPAMITLCEVTRRSRAERHEESPSITGQGAG